MKLSLSAAVAATLACAAVPALAGGMAAPVTEPEVIAADTAAGGDDWVVPLMLLVLIAAALAGSDGTPNG